MSRVMPAQKPGRSKQDYGTPWELIRVIEELQGRAFDVDLAARADNSKAVQCLTPEMNSLTVSWAGSFIDGMAWLNPEFGMIPAFVKKCAEETDAPSNDFTIYVLVPASIGAAWYRKHVYPFATTYALYPRIPFEGWHETAFPKDCILCEYGPDARPTIVEPLEWITNAEALACREGAGYGPWQAMKKASKKEGHPIPSYQQWLDDGGFE